MSPRAARSPSNLQAARATVTERARRSVGPARNGPGGKAGARGKSGSARGGQGKSGQSKGGQSKGGQEKQAPDAKAATAPAAAGRGRRSTGVVLRRIHPASVLRVSALFYLG
ncbi:MAG TPA: hypothetical protein VGV93_05620, partial [Acidimicrobiales bacterium]|nr:hypothetical protein [Acidimicrobiales bacterium]